MEYRPGCSGKELYSPPFDVVTSRFTLVVRLRISTTAPATGDFCGSVMSPTMDPSSNCAHAQLASSRLQSTARNIQKDLPTDLYELYHRWPALMGLPSRKSISISFSLVGMRATTFLVLLSITAPPSG